MKHQLITLFTLITLICSAQISVGPKPIGQQTYFKKGVLNKMKNTKTIFVLPEYLIDEEGEKILEENWTITPFKIVRHNDFNLINYLNRDHSFFNMELLVITRTSKSYTTVEHRPYFDFFMIENSKELLNKVNNVKQQKRERKLKKWLDDYKLNYARINLYIKNNNRDVYANNNSTILNKFYTENLFHNTLPGFFKNNIQQINKALTENKPISFDLNEYTPELKELATTPLYIPSYVAINFDPLTMDSNEDPEYFNQLFSKYTFETKITTAESISDKIMNKENFYYFRYTRYMGRSIEIVNSLTGNVVYKSKYNILFHFNIQPKHIAHLDKKIKKAVKKY